MKLENNIISPRNLKWIKLKTEDTKDITEFKILYDNIFSINKKYPNTEEIVKGLDKSYLILLIKDSDKVIGFSVYQEVDNDELEIVNWYGPICSKHEIFRPPGYLGQHIKKINIIKETKDICSLCESWTC
jgi:hypothetical protein